MFNGHTTTLPKIRTAGRHGKIFGMERVLTLRAFRPMRIKKGIQLALFVPPVLLALPIFFYSLVSLLGGHLYALLYLLPILGFTAVVLMSDKKQGFTPLFLTSVILLDVLTVIAVISLGLLVFSPDSQCPRPPGYSHCSMLESSVSPAAFWGALIVILGATVAPFVALVGMLAQLPLVIAQRRTTLESHER